MKENNYEQISFWKKALPEIQNKNFSIFIELIEENNSDDYILYSLFSNTNKNVLEEHSAELLELISKYKKQLNLSQKLWEALDGKAQKENSDILVDLIDLSKSGGKDVAQIWKSTKKEIQDELVEILLNKYSVDKNVTLQLFRGLNIELSKENFVLCLETCEKQLEDYNLSYEVYKKLFKLNKNVHDTIDLDIFNSRLLKIFDIDKLARITTYPDLQSRLLTICDVQGIEKVLNHIGKDENTWVMELDNIINNINNYPDLLGNLNEENIDEHTAKMLIQVFSQKENYFNISTIADVRNYYSIRRDICKRILNGEEIENLSPAIASYSDEDKKRFAILEMMYGIDIEEAKNLVEKYGKDIEDIVYSPGANRTALALIGIKRILECEIIQEKYNKNKSLIDNDLENIEYSSIATLEANCLEMYSELYKKTLYTPSETDKASEVEYNGKKIEVYEINSDFNMFIRAEGACNGWNEPENFAAHLEKPSTRYHGNCKSFIGQDSISVPSSQGPKYGYSQCEPGGLLLGAPWDIMSNDANTQFSTASTKWNLNCGIQLRIPQKVIDNTRHGYNEFVFERLLYDNETEVFKNDKPQYVVYVQEPDLDKESDGQWRITKKAASQIGIPIVIIDREKFAKRELEKFENLRDIFLGTAENINHIPETELLENMIVSFENNANGIAASSALRNKYFSVEQRTNMVKGIWGRIKSFKDENFEKYTELLDKFVEVVQNEESKTHSNTGSEVAKSRYGEDFLNTLKQKQEEAREDPRSKKDNLMQIYNKFGVERDDLTRSKEFLSREIDSKEQQPKNEDVNR